MILGVDHMSNEPLSRQPTPGTQGACEDDGRGTARQASLGRRVTITRYCTGTNIQPLGLVHLAYLDDQAFAGQAVPASAFPTMRGKCSGS